MPQWGTAAMYKHKNGYEASNKLIGHVKNTYPSFQSTAANCTSFYEPKVGEKQQFMP